MVSELVAGIDAAPTGWVACVADLAGDTVHFVGGTGLADVWDRRWTTVGIDMPMGLPARDRRVADAEARAILGRRSSTLFATPVHDTLAAGDYADALARSRAASGRGLSVQAFHLLPRVRELRAFLGGPTTHVHEVHPETSFTVMNGGTPLAPKTTGDGRSQRRRLVRSWRRATAATDDLTIDHLDAAAAAWTATRIATGRHRLLGDDDVDPDGFALTMAV